MKNHLFAFLPLFFFGSPIVAQPTAAERFGYSKDAKLLIIHADDLWVSHSENRASIKAMEEGCVNSASIMVPCPWFPEIAEYAKNHPTMDFGLHLTVTSEWKHYKWGPTYHHDDMASFRNNEGYFYESVAYVVEKGDAKVLKDELMMQVRQALDAGINVTHLDAHMGAVMATPEFLEAYILTGRKFNLPVLLDNSIPAMQSPKIQSILDKKDILVDATITALPNDYRGGMDQFYRKTLNELKPGLNCLLIHTAFDDQEMRAVTSDHLDWGAAWRQADYDFFTSKACEELLKDNNIQLVTWLEIRDKVTRAD